jgi:hypothetical protein
VVFYQAGVLNECWKLSVGYYGLQATHTVIHEFTLKMLYSTRVSPNNKNKMWTPIHFSRSLYSFRASGETARFAVEYSFHRNAFRSQELGWIDILNAYASSAYLYLSDAYFKPYDTTPDIKTDFFQLFFTVLNNFTTFVISHTKNVYKY